MSVRSSKSSAVAVGSDQPLGVVLLDVSPAEGQYGSEQFDTQFFQRLGHPVLVCHGPAVNRLCPLLGGEECEKFERAHGIVFKLDLDRAQHREIVERYRALARPALPISVVTAPEQAERYRDVLAGVEVWTHEPTVAELDGFAARVEAADRIG